MDQTLHHCVGTLRKVMTMDTLYPQMADAFPDFPQESLPSIPPTWTDVSFANDACPCFANEDGWLIFIDYPASYQREHPESKRFYAVGCDADYQIDESNGSCATDDWEGLLKWL